MSRTEAPSGHDNPKQMPTTANTSAQDFAASVNATLQRSEAIKAAQRRAIALREQTRGPLPPGKGEQLRRQMNAALDEIDALGGKSSDTFTQIDALRSQRRELLLPAWREGQGSGTPHFLQPTEDLAYVNRQLESLGARIDPDTHPLWR